MELCSGPLYILAKVQLADGVVAVAEASATIAKGALTLLLLKRSSAPVPITLSWAQVKHNVLLHANSCSSMSLSMLGNRQLCIWAALLVARVKLRVPFGNTL